MAILFGDNNSNSFRLTLDPARNYGLEDDRVAGLDGGDSIWTGAGNDYIDGGADGDFLSDGDGNDTVLGGSGNDELLVGAGNDTYYGGEGIDRLNFLYVHQSAGDTDLEGERSSVGITLDLASTALQDLGEFGTDRFYGFEDAWGTDGDDRLLGTTGPNVLSGQSGDDELNGRSGNDILADPRGNDTLIGGRGADVLQGGLGADNIYTGPADGVRDRVYYIRLQESGVTAATRDVIFEFVHRQDKIDLRAIDADPLLDGNQAFRVVSAFTSALGEVRLVRSGADTIIQVDGDADASVDMTIRVAGVFLTGVDLIL